MLPPLEVATARHYCEQRVPPRAIHEVRVELVVERGALTIVERRAPWSEDYGPEWTSRGIARLRFTANRGEWRLYWRDQASWHLYDRVGAVPRVGPLLDEIDRDPVCIFWG